MQHSLHNYNYNQRNPDSRNVSGNKSKETNRSADYSTTKPPTSKPTSNEKAHDHSASSVEKSEPDRSQINSKSMPILNEKVFASKCTISDSAPPSVASKDRPVPEPVRAKDDSKDKESSANSSSKTSKNNSTDSEGAPAGSQPQSQPQAPAPPEESASVSGNSSINLNKSTLSQAKPASNYPSSIQHQQSTSSSSSQLQTPPLSSSSISSKFSGTPVPNRVFVGGISTDTTEAELQSLFSQFGIIKAVKIIIDREGIPKGYGFITYTTEEEANKVLKESDNLVLKNRKLNVAIAVKKQPSNPSLSSSANLTRNFDLNQYFQNGGNIPFYGLPNGLSSIPTAYMNEYGPISFGPDALYAYAASPLAGLPPHSNPPFAPFPLVYRPSSLYYPSSTVSMHPSHHQTANHPGPSNPNAAHLPLNHPSLVQSPVNLQQQAAGNAQDQYSSQQTSIQSHSNQPQSNQQSQAQAAHHHHPSSRMGANSANNPNSNQMGGGGGVAGGNQPDGGGGGGGYQSQYHSHLHHLNPSGSHHQHLHHSHPPTHAQTSNLVASNTSNANQQHTAGQPVFISNPGMPYGIHPLHSLQYNLAGQAAFGANTTQPHQTSMNQSHYAHNPLSSQHSQVNQFPMNPNWVNNSQWR